MAITGKGSLSLRKKDVQQQKLAGTAYRRLVFAHKAAAGETGVTFTSLTQPSEMASLGFTNPSSADILAANILFYKKNLTVISSLRGVLMQDLSYTVPTSSRIQFQGFTSEAGEIFTCLLETGVKDGLNVVDATPIIATGELAIGQTDFNVGTPFEVNKYNTQQVGAVLVFRNGVIQFRNPSNSTSGGNYQEVDSGNGLGTIIRFNSAAAGDSDNIVVWGHLLAERPSGSMMAAIESLAGQVDKIIPTLAEVAGVSESTFQAAPNNQDLRAFGNVVTDHENRLDLVLGLTTYLKDVKSNNTQGGTFTSGSYQTRTINTQTGDTTFCSLSNGTTGTDGTANQFTLQPGIYQIEASAPAFGVGLHKTRLYNVTDSSSVILGQNASNNYVSATGYATGRSYISGIFSISSVKTFEIQHRGAVTYAGSGFGFACNFGDNEIYTEVKITKIGV